jgi:hypothetical protein
MQATVGSAPDALTQYLSAYGVSDQPVQGQIQADQLQAQQGAGNFNNLTNLLSSIAQSGASSRGAESAMGQNLFDTTLGQERAGYKTKAEMAQADAMRQIQQIMYRTKIGSRKRTQCSVATVSGCIGCGWWKRYRRLPVPIQVDPEEERRRGIAEAMAARRGY